MNKGDLIVFDSKKNFKYIKSLGAGGTGDTHLFLDETTGIQFAIKKYAPKDFRYVDEYSTSHTLILCGYIITTFTQN